MVWLCTVWFSLAQSNSLLCMQIQDGIIQVTLSCIQVSMVGNSLGLLIKKSKGKVHPRIGHEDPVGSRGIALLFL